jgi:hypothetical protein
MASCLCSDDIIQRMLHCFVGAREGIEGFAVLSYSKTRAGPVEVSEGRERCLSMVALSTGACANSKACIRCIMSLPDIDWSKLLVRFQTGRDTGRRFKHSLSAANIFVCHYPTLVRQYR